MNQKTAQIQGDANEYTSEQLEAVLAQLSTDQIRFIVSRLEFGTDKEAAEAIDLKPNTVYHWPLIVKEAVRLLAEDGLVVARHVRRRHLAKAMLIKAGGLDSDNEMVRQKAATEIVEWEMGKATQPTDNKHELDAKREGVLEELLGRMADAMGNASSES